MAQTAEADAEAVQQIVGRYFDAWNSHDLAPMADLFTPDATWINVVGMYWVGRDEVVGAHRALHQTIFKGNQQALQSVAFRALTPDTGLAVVSCIQDAYVTPDGHPMPQALDRLSFLMVRVGPGWKIAHGHNTIVNPEAAKNDPALRLRAARG